MGGRECKNCDCPKSMHDTGWDAAGCMKEGCNCQHFDAVSAVLTGTLPTVAFAGTTSASITAPTGSLSGSGKEVSPQSKTGLKRTPARRTAKVTNPTPLGADLPTIRGQVERMLGTEDGEKEMLDMIKHDLLTNYILEVQAGQDSEMNPQHSRASRKQSKEIAELLIQLTKHG